jgi:uracil-DNA glycosylase family 4
MPKFVGGEGSPNAKIMIIGEAPGSQEDLMGRPFVGPAGELLDQLLRDAGINRGMLYVTNISKYKLPNNNFDGFDLVHNPKDKALEVLWTEINTVNPNVIVALGSNVLRELTGKSKIANWRGSILQSVRGYPKVVPTFRPAHLLYMRDSDDESDNEISGYWQKFIIAFDLQRAVKQSSFKEFRLPDRLLHVAKSSSDLYSFLQRHKDRHYCAVDIEVIHSIPVCIALSFTRSEALSIPLLDQINGMKLCDIPTHDLAFCWNMIDKVLNDPKIKILGQNYKFDQERLERICGITTHSLFCDTMMMSHTLYPELPKGLAFLCSFYTEEPYYKDEGKEFNPKKDKLDRLYLYNAKDAAVTMEVFEEQLKEYAEIFGVTV